MCNVVYAILAKAATASEIAGNEGHRERLDDLLTAPADDVLQAENRFLRSLGAAS